MGGAGIKLKVTVQLIAWHLHDVARARMTCVNVDYTETVLLRGGTVSKSGEFDRRFKLFSKVASSVS